MDQKIIRGDTITVKITGIQPFGAFGLLPDNTSGLIHISEISDKFVSSVDNFVKIGQSVEVKVLDFDEQSGHAKLSLKALNKQKRKDKRVYYKNPRHSIKETPYGFKYLAKELPKWIELGIREE